jgi:cellulose synthase/poly-beta-1,6-N-acetylglucosamine synthase-like glycosyltransferase/peptidoglycan/xylan/chitin deacetylase (PgdA/CDA1 family)
MDPDATEPIAIIVKEQIFHSPGGRRGRFAIVLVALLTAIGVVGWQWGMHVTAALPSAHSYNSSPEYSSEIAAAMAGCGLTHGEYGPAGTSQIPVIGSGIFQRVVLIVPDGSTSYAVDPFTGQVVQPLTSLQQHATQDCKYAIQEYGQVPKNTIVLAYTNGPNMQWTPRLLGVLQYYHVDATFFDSGTSILADPQEFSAELSTGNVVGNQSLDNPDLSDQTGTQGRQELVTSARIMAVDGHYQSMLFDAPDISGDKKSVTQALFATLVAQQLGFTSVDLSNTSTEYLTSQSQTPVLQRDGAGAVVVMQDSTASGSATLKSSIALIHQAEDLGYSFMTVPQLDTLPGAGGPLVTHIRPSLTDQLGYWMYSGPHIELTHVLKDIMNAMTIGIGLITLIWILAAVWGRFYNYRKVPKWQPDRVSILVPAWNESKVIRRTVESIVRYKYDFELEIVLVDDGSTDDTWEIMQELQAEYPTVVKPFTKDNGGKARALNYGLFIGVTTDYTLIIDADTIVADGETIPRLVRWFVDERCGVVAGRTKAGYRGKTPMERMLSEFQAAEYDLGIATMRTAQDWMNGIVIVPGSCSMFRTSLLRSIGGFKSHIIAEDAAAGLELRRRYPGMRIRQDLTSVALTEVPHTVKTMFNQWRRWQFGVMQVMVEHREIFGRPDKYGGLTIQLWWSLYSLIVPTLFLPITYVMIIVTAVSGNWHNLVLYPAVFLAYRILTTIVSMFVMREWMNPATAIWYRIINDPMQMYLAITCWSRVLTGNVQTKKIWTKLPRQGYISHDGKSSPPTGLRRVAGPPPEPVAAVTGAEAIAADPMKTALIDTSAFAPVPTPSMPDTMKTARIDTSALAPSTADSMKTALIDTTAFTPSRPDPTPSTPDTAKTAFIDVTAFTSGTPAPAANAPVPISSAPDTIKTALIDTSVFAPSTADTTKTAMFATTAFAASAGNNRTTVDGPNGNGTTLNGANAPTVDIANGASWTNGNGNGAHATTANEANGATGNGANGAAANGTAKANGNGNETTEPQSMPETTEDLQRHP